MLSIFWAGYTSQSSKIPTGEPFNGNYLQQKIYFWRTRDKDKLCECTLNIKSGEGETLLFFQVKRMYDQECHTFAVVHSTICASSRQILHHSTATKGLGMAM